MINQDGKYNIKAMCNLLGIQAGTLRAWERRYHFIEPVRNDAGHRLYTEEQLTMLKWIVLKINQGFTVGQAVNLLQHDKHIIIAQGEEGKMDRTERIIASLVEYFRCFDEQNAHNIMDEAFDVFTIDKVINEILTPLLIKIGKLKDEFDFTSAHEHFALSFLRFRIVMLMNNIKPNGLLPKVIAVCGPNETQDVSLLFFTLFLKRKGFDVVYLGNSIETDDIDQVISAVSPKFIFISATKEKYAEKTMNWAKNIQNKYEDLFVGIGGHGFLHCSSKGKDDDEIYIGLTSGEWETWITERL